MTHLVAICSIERNVSWNVKSKQSQIALLFFTATDAAAILDRVYCYYIDNDPPFSGNLNERTWTETNAEQVKSVTLLE